MQEALQTVQHRLGVGSKSPHYTQAPALQAGPQGSRSQGLAPKIESTCGGRCLLCRHFRLSVVPPGAPLLPAACPLDQVATPGARRGAGISRYLEVGTYSRYSCPSCCAASGGTS